MQVFRHVIFGMPTIKNEILFIWLQFYANSSIFELYFVGKIFYFEIRSYFHCKLFITILQFSMLIRVRIFCYTDINIKIFRIIKNLMAILEIIVVFYRLYYFVLLMIKLSNQYWSLSPLYVNLKSPHMIKYSSSSIFFLCFNTFTASCI